VGDWHGSATTRLFPGRSGLWWRDSAFEGSSANKGKIERLERELQRLRRSQSQMKPTRTNVQQAAKPRAKVTKAEKREASKAAVRRRWAMTSSDEIVRKSARKSAGRKSGPRPPMRITSVVSGGLPSLGKRR
jgi:branched-subunit amino acid aminotransferase/4-amino-4-deoxychorismate lyase